MHNNPASNAHQQAGQYSSHPESTSETDTHSITAITPDPDSLWLLPSLLKNLQRRADSTVCRYQNRDISGGLLLNKALRLSAALQVRGVNSSSRAGVALGRSPDTLVVMLALWHLGAAYVPLDSSLPRERLLAQHEAAGLTHLIVQPALQEVFAMLPASQILLAPVDYGNSPEEISASVSSPAATGNSTATAYILFTSGSTGAPKVVAISHRNLATLFNSILAVLKLPPQLRLLGCANPCFDIAMFEWLCPLLTDACLVLADAEQCRDAQQLVTLIHCQSVTAVQATPSLWRLLVRHADFTSLRLEVAISTGEALNKALASKLLPSTKVLWNLYGPTECTLWASACQVTPGDLVVSAPVTIPIGTALPDYTLVLNPEPDSTPESGELVIEGPAVASGYLQASPQQQASFSAPEQNREHWRYATGDRCIRDADGILHYLGRLDSQVKCNGYRLDLEEIAQYLRRHNSVEDACCLLAPDRGAGDQLLAFLLWKPGQPNKNRQQLRAHLARWLPDWMLPQQYIPLAVWPLGANGKLDQHALLALTTPVHPPTIPVKLLDPLLPESAREADSVTTAVAGIFCELLGLKQISPGDNFFDLGGNSMLAATLLMIINDHFASSLSLRQILVTPPSVARIAQLLLQSEKADSVLPPASL